MEEVKDRAERTARYIVETGCTVRQAAAHFGVSKSTVHKDVAYRLKDIDPSLYEQAEKVMQFNKSQRHIRGGMATRLKYRIKRERRRGKIMNTEE